MGCANSYCYSTSPSTTTVTYTTTEDGSAITITTTAVTTPATPVDAVSSTSDGAVAKFFPTTEAKVTATSAAGSSGGNGGLSKGTIGGIVAAAVVILIVVLAAAFFIIKRLRHTEKAVQSHRETTSGTHTRQTTEKKSEVNVRVQPTPSEVDAMDYDPLMIRASRGSPRRSQQQPHAGNGRSRSGSDDAASQPSLCSGPSAGLRWNTPSVTSDTDDNNNSNNNNNNRTYFELPPRVQSQPGAARAQIRNSVNSTDSTSQYSYHNFVYAPGHNRQWSNASSEELASQHGMGSPLIELGVDGAFTPELPGGSDTETESNSGGGGGSGGSGGRRSPRGGGPRRGSANPSINNIVSPMSTTAANRPPLAQANRPRRRGDSLVSPVEGQNGAGGARLGSIDESVTTATTTTTTTTTNSLHGHYGPPVRGGSEMVDRGNSPTVPGFVSIGPEGWERPSQDISER